MKTQVWFLSALILLSFIPLSALDYAPAPKSLDLAAAAQGQEFRFYLETAEGSAIPFLLMVPGPVKVPTSAVIFLPQYKGTASMWKTQARNATAMGIFSLSLQVETPLLGKPALEWEQVDKAMAQVLAWLRTLSVISPERIGIVGSSLGANHSLLIFAADARLNSVFALSPGLDYIGCKPGDALAATGTRKAVVAAAMDDQESYKALLEWKPKYPQVEYLGMINGGHGYLLVQNQPEVAARLKQFLQELR